jgi:peptidoglycan/xylan/chitin deacetylase (PgdA/CDA1 family)
VLHVLDLAAALRWGAAPRTPAARATTAAAVIVPVEPPNPQPKPSTTTAPSTVPPAPSTTAPPEPAPPTAPVVHGRIHDVPRGEPGAPTVALTFDDGPDPRWTPAVLDILSQAGVPATFCLVGRQVRRFPDLTRTVAASGAALCDHTDGHVEHLSRYPQPTIDAEITSLADVVEQLTGRRPTLFRPPGGDFSSVLVDAAAAHDMDLLEWSVDPRDWRPATPDELRQRVLDAVRPGSVVLLHDGGGDRSATVAMLPGLIDALRQQGYRFVVPGGA